MGYVADLHLHSRFSRACSKDINIPNLAKWAKIKGVDLLGTGDFLYPLWQKELRVGLKKVGDGIYEKDGMKFILTNEVSCIYSDKGKVRRVHLLLIFPSFESVENLGRALLKRGVNLSSDGRPIMGLSAHDLSQIIFEIEPQAIIIPAHIWTPWFGMFGSESGYDSLEEGFLDLTDQIIAVETGLSSEPAMNWRVSELDNRSIVSFSDAHSVSKLAREASIFAGEIGFSNLREDLKTQNLVGTIEFFPEEGKYHYSGHRNCDVVYSPQDVNQKGEICPVCGKKLTIGVMQRVDKLATRGLEDLKLKTEDSIVKSEVFSKRPGFRMLVGLEKIISEATNSGVGSQKVQKTYDNLIQNLGSELKILTKVSIKDIERVGGERVAEGVERAREGKLTIEPGFDNTYGKIKIWNDEEKSSKVQIALF